MTRKIFFFLSIIAFLSGAAIAWAATTTYGNVNVATADAYSSTGDLVSGWDWLRDSPHTDSSLFTFNNVATDTANGKVYLRFSFLVTNRVNGGSGYSTNIRVNFPGASIGQKVVRLSNLTPLKDPTDTAGFGYTANGTTVIRADKVPDSGTLRIRIRRIAGQSRHVATKVGDGSTEGLMVMWR